MPSSDRFDAWFDRSQVVDASGSPLVVYHGTNSDFDAFTRIDGGNMWGRGIYLITDPATASGYALGHPGRITPKGNAAPNVIPVYVSMQKPFDMADAASPQTIDAIEKALGESLSGHLWPGMKNRDLRQVLAMQFTDWEGANAAIRAAGFDGIRETTATAGQGQTLMVFEPGQIKSAIGNSGRYDPRNPDITDRAASPLQPEVVDDDGDMPGAKLASFDDDAYLRYGQDRSGNLRLQSIHASDNVRGRDMVRWLGTTYKRPIVVDEVTFEAIGFWNRMLDQNLIANWTDRRFKGSTVPVREKARGAVATDKVAAAAAASVYIQTLPQKAAPRARQPQL